MIEDLPDIGAVRDERDDAHLSAADGAQRGKHLVDVGDQHRPQVVRGTLRRNGVWAAKPRVPVKGYGLVVRALLARPLARRKPQPLAPARVAPSVRLVPSQSPPPATASSVPVR